jgi:hypothetical protein
MTSSSKFSVGPQENPTIRNDGTAFATEAADLHRRAEICQEINDPYLNDLAVVDTDTTLQES